MTTEEVKAMPVSQKLQIMEMIWDDLHDRFEHSELSSKCKALLDERRKRVKEGDARILDWDSVKSTIGRS